jgi:K+-transporting ATPase ATPase A chain
MTLNGWIQILVFCGIVIALMKPLGGYMTRVFNGDRTLLSPVLGPIERGLYRLAEPANARSSTGRPMRSRCCCSTLPASWCSMGCSACKASCLSTPPDGAVSPGPGLQHGGQLRDQHQLAELWRRKHHVLSVQMVGLTVQNFVSAATGIAIAIALIRGFPGHRASRSAISGSI